MGIFTSFMVSLAEFSQVASIGTVILCTSLMLAFILRIVSLDLLNGFPGGVVRVPPSKHAHRVNMEARPLEVSIKSVNKVNSSKLQVQLSLTEGVDAVLYRAYWGVAIEAFHHVLRSPWSWFVDAFKHGNLFGSEGCCILDSKQTVTKEGPLSLELECHNLDLGQAPRTKYPLVLVFSSKNSDEDNRESFVIYVIHIEDKGFMSFSTHVLYNFIKLEDSRVTQLVPIYPESDSCVVCLSRPTSRVTLPCRHACLCSYCFTKLPQKKCPMCRTVIETYFVLNQVDDDDAIPEESEAELEAPPLTWRQRLAELEHRFAMAVGLQEND